MNYTFDFASVLEQWPLLAQGAWVTVKLSFCATVLGFILGTLCALARNSRLGWLRAVAGGYVELIRNTPLLIQAYFLIFGLSSAGLTMPIMAGAVLALVINIGAYTCEIVRAGIESIPKDQLEAGECLALSRLQVFWHVVLRPAVERVYPSLTSQFVLLMLASSIMSAVGAEELLGVANRIQSDTYRNFEVFIVLWGVYLALSWRLRLGFWLLAQVVFPRRRKLGTPLLVLMGLCFFGPSLFGLGELSALAAAGLAMTIYSSAFLGEIWRGCIQAVPKNQWEAAECLGLSRLQRMAKVVLPQALRIATPPTVGFLVQIIKNTSIASLVIGYPELAYNAKILNNSTFQPFVYFGCAAILYFLMCYPLSRWSRSLERRLNASRR